MKTPETIYLMDGGDGIVWCDHPAPGEGMRANDAVKYVQSDLVEQQAQRIDQLSADLDELSHRDTEKAQRIQELEMALKRQASAAKMGMDAAKSTGMEALEIAKRMRAESSPEALDSERAANAQLTEENEALKKQLAKLPDPAWERHTSELLDSQAYQLEQLAKAVLAGYEVKARQLAKEVLK